ncbi:MAG: AAA domain-containing protein [Nitrospiraceae bacterium]|nr:AAA domain-containing protein [Nitrospiraceae bacterium]
MNSVTDKGDITLLDPEEVKEYQKTLIRVKNEVKKVIIGQEKTVDMILKAILSNGSILVEGVPGVAKTLIIKTISSVMGCKFSRVQFTPDLLPTDIVGVTTYEKERGFYVLKGPIFANFVLADEINRAPPKVQSALLEGMQEKQVTIGKETFPLPLPFFIMATQNPLEQMGTYPLPEAQMDRFLFKINVVYPSIDEEEQVLENNATTKKFEEFHLTPLLSPEKIVKLQHAINKVYASEKIRKYVVRIVDATRNPSKYKLNLGKYIEWGASPRGSIGLYVAGKADAFMNGKNYVTPQNIKSIAREVLNHRIYLNYEGESESISVFDIIDEILAKVPIP